MKYMLTMNNWKCLVRSISAKARNNTTSHHEIETGNIRMPRIRITPPQILDGAKWRRILTPIEIYLNMLTVVKYSSTALMILSSKPDEIEGQTCNTEGNAALYHLSSWCTAAQFERNGLQWHGIVGTPRGAFNNCLILILMLHNLLVLTQ